MMIKDKNSWVTTGFSLGAVAVSSFSFYVTAAAPSIDPLAGLADHIYEASTLCLVSALTLAFMSVVKPDSV
tara:strand:+ start:3626 stop:3838 length:213 start_codon:yes stop_codon:yes gene_type:complete